MLDVEAAVRRDATRPVSGAMIPGHLRVGFAQPAGPLEAPLDRPLVERALSVCPPPPVIRLRAARPDRGCRDPGLQSKGREREEPVRAEPVLDDEPWAAAGGVDRQADSAGR